MAVEWPPSPQTPSFDQDKAEALRPYIPHRTQVPFLSCLFYSVIGDFEKMVFGEF